MDLNQFTVTTTLIAVCVTVLSIAIIWIFSLFDMNRDAKATSTSTGNNSNNNKAGATETDELEDYKKLLSSSSDQRTVYGFTDKYNWNQNESEVEVSIPLKTVKDSKQLKKSLSVAINSKSLKVSLEGNVLVEGSFPSPVLADENVWHIDNNNPNSPKLVITLFKRDVTTREQYWKCLLKGDAEVNTNRFAQQPSDVDSMNEESMKKAIDEMKRQIDSSKKQ